MVTNLISSASVYGVQGMGRRSSQQDSFAVHRQNGPGSDDGILLLAVADGMGGHTAGTNASQTAIHAFVEAFQKTGGTIGEKLRSALLSGNEQLAREIEADPELSGMGSTFLGVAISSEELEWISVGDSILWHYQGGQLVRLNADHSMRPVLDLQIARGEITARQAAQHPQRNQLRSALIGEAISLIDPSPEPVPIKPGDRVILGSDGVLALSEDEIKTILEEGAALDSKGLANRLLDAVESKRAENQDNTTILVATPPFGAAAEKRGIRARPWLWFLSGLLLIVLIFIGLLG